MCERMPGALGRWSRTGKALGHENESQQAQPAAPLTEHGSEAEDQPIGFGGIRMSRLDMTAALAVLALAILPAPGICADRNAMPRQMRRLLDMTPEQFEAAADRFRATLASL